MTDVPVYNVALPYVGVIQGGLYPGRMVRIQGTALPVASRFAVNLQCGASTVPRSDIALHMSCRFPENVIVRNSLQSMSWGPEESSGHMPLFRGQSFEIIVLCEPDHYKIAINGKHFTEYIHRIPYQQVSYLAIDGDVTIGMISYEGSCPSAAGFMPPTAPGYIAPPVGMSYPPMSGTMSGAYSSSVPYPAAPGPYPAAPGPYPAAPGPYPVAPGPYPAAPGPYPAAPGPYPAAPGPYPGQPGYNYQQPYGQQYPPPGGSYPPPPPGYNPSSHKGGGGILDKAQAAVSSILGPRTGAGVAGTALGAGLAGAALSGHLNPKKALKANKKSRKKALKYGLPLAGVGLGAYALKKGFHGRSSSSSSSSSSEEE